MVHYGHLELRLREPSLFTLVLYTHRQCENKSIVVGLFFLIIPALQLKGRYLRVRDVHIAATCMH
jgi:hypothetical protein